jgi:aryl-alcohol dehydrogenase-like predicted oxidoreductase
MEYVNLGRSGVKVSRLCLGTMNFGPFTDVPTSFAIMDRALELGINFFDTANVYGQDAGRGRTEQIIGEWLAQGGSRRESIVLATKYYGRIEDGVNDRGASAYHIRKACEDSLRRLQTDHIDLYQMHHIDRSTLWEEVFQALEQLVREGKIIYAGTSNFAGWNIAMASELAKQRHFLGFVSEQSVYSLRNRSIELEVIPACKAYGLAVIPWSPLAGGMLAGIFAKADSNEGYGPGQGGASPPDARRQRPSLMAKAEELKPQVLAYEELCREIGIDYADVALAWVLQQDGITSPIVGPRSIAQLEANVAALNVHLDAETLNRLDAIWPGPGGQAPEAYAW